MNNDYPLQQKQLVEQLEHHFANGSGPSTVVEMQKDYANDDRICLTSVVFVPEHISRKIVSDVIERLRAIEPKQYFYSPESMHLTIKNVRTISKPPLFSDLDIHRVDRLFSEIVPRFPVFEFSVEDVLLFPTSVSIMAYSSEALQKLVLCLDDGLKEIGIPDNKTYLSDCVYWGNITVCRFTQKPSVEFIQEMKKMRNMKIGKFVVEKINLLTCNAVCHPESKNVIHEYALKKDNPQPV